MKKLHALCICFAVMLAGSAIQTQGQPVSAIESIHAELDNSVPTYERFFPNVFDPTHPKWLEFKGSYESQQTDGNLVLQFDWFDLAGAKQYSPGVPFPLIAGGGPIDEMYELDFCPPEVSIHFHLEGTNPSQNPVVAVDGDFSHICHIGVPENLTGYEVLILLGLLCGRAAFRARAGTRS